MAFVVVQNEACMVHSSILRYGVLAVQEFSMP